MIPGDRATRSERGDHRSPQRAFGRLSRKANLYGVLVTYRRPDALVTMLEALAVQGRRIDHLFVVDNAPDDSNRSRLHSYVARGLPATYLAAEGNTGPAGGISLGMERVLCVAEDEDWVVLLDDDDPPWEPGWLEELWSFAVGVREVDPRVAAVGTAGSRFDRKRGRLIRTPDEDLHGAVPVDVIGGNQFPFYRVAAIRNVGPFRRELFFGFEELEYGLRLRTAGWSLYTLGRMNLHRRQRSGRLGLSSRPSLRVGAVHWRSYYSLRNLVWICRSHGWRRTALRLSVVHGLAKPVVNLVRRPLQSWRMLRLHSRACADAWRGRLGRTIDPALRLDGSYGSRARPRVREA
jgi:GT2 family glycosyltransferase